MQSTTRGSIEMAAAMAISGTIGWVVVQAQQPLAVLVFWRCVFGTLARLAACAALRVLRVLPPRTLALAALGGALLVGNWLLIFGAFAHAPIGVATAVYNVNPFLYVLFAALLLRQRPTRRQLAWLAVAFGGVVLVALGRGGSRSVPAGGHYALGLAMAVGAALLYAASAVTTKRLQGVPPQLLALVHTATGSLLLAPWALALPLPQGPQWGPLAALGVVYTGGMYILLYSGLQRLPPVAAGVLNYVYPVVALAVDYLAFGLRLDALQGVGVLAILVAAGALALARPATTAPAAAAPRPRPAPAAR